MLSCKQFTVNP